MICIILHYLGKASAFLVSVLVGIIVLIAFSPAFIGLNLLGFQIVFWAGTEEWIGIHLSDAVDILAADLAFFDRLRDLDGPLGRAFEMIPLAFLLIVAGFLLASSVAYTYDGLRDKLRRGREKPSQNDPVSDHSHAIKPRPRIDYPIRNASKKRPLQHWRPPRHEEPQSITDKVRFRVEFYEVQSEDTTDASQEDGERPGEDFV